MSPKPRPRLWILLLVASLVLSACSGSHLDPPEMQGPPVMVDDGGQPRLWLLSKQEESRQVSVGGATSRMRTDWRTDTFFHFHVQAFDPVTSKPLWKKTVVTLGDPEAKGTQPSRVIGSAVGARLLGQDGNAVWLLVGEAPFAVSAADGSLIADAAALEQRNPDLKGLLPSEAKHYRFDRGLVLMAADARQFVVRGPQLQASEYVPTPAAIVARPTRGARRLSEPLRPPIGEVPERHVLLDGQWLGLYSPKEVADIGEDPWGEKLDYSYTVLDEGTTARRTFWRGDIVTAQSFDERFERLDNITPVAGAPVYLKGRFVKVPGTDDALVLDDPAGVLVWHSTRIDSAGRAALTRLDAALKPLWTTELPVSDSNTLINPLDYWLLPDRVVVMGLQQSEVDGVTRYEPHLVSVSVKDGARQAWNMTREAAVP